MSTQLRRIAQAPAHAPSRTRYFLATEILADTQIPSTSSIVTLNNDATLSFLTTEADFNSDYTAGSGLRLTPVAGTLLKDLGREVNVIGADGNRLSKYRQVQIVDGTGSGGVGFTTSATSTTAPDPWNSNLFVRVWAANGSAVYVARTG